jgi:hypothetical protein
MGLIADFIYKIDPNRITEKNRAALNLQSPEKSLGASCPRKLESPAKIKHRSARLSRKPWAGHHLRHRSGDGKTGNVPRRLLFRLQFFEQFALCGDPI